MGNYISTKTEIKNYITARTPLIIVNSYERERVEQMLREIASELNSDVSYYTDAKQVCSLRSGTTVNADNDPLLFIANAFKKNRNSIFAFGDIKRIGEDNAFSREVLNILYLAKENNCTLIVITADVVWDRLVQFGMLTTLDYPDMDERVDQIKEFFAQYSGRFSIELSEEEIWMAATLLKGFSKIQIENILSAELVRTNGFTSENLFALTNQKRRMYSSQASIQPVFVNRKLEVSGLDELKSWLDEKKKVFFASEEDLEDRDLTPPKGILLMGVPGCGKSLSAKMIAREWELPLLRFDLGTVYDKWVGESEKRMKESLQFFENVSPCIVWIDEIEKALSVSDSGNDVGKRILGQFLFWLQESKSRVFLVATANDISQLPFELFRKGRFSEIFFIDLPNDNERKEAILQYATRSLHFDLTESQLDKLILISNGFSYSDIEYALKDIAQLALVEGQSAISFDALEKSFNSVVPISQSNPEMVEKVRKWGSERAVLASSQGDRV